MNKEERMCHRPARLHQKKCKIFILLIILVFLFVLFSQCLDPCVTELPKLWLSGSIIDMEKLVRVEPKPTSLRIADNASIQNVVDARRTVWDRYNVNCRAMFNGDEDEMTRARDFMQEHERERLTSEDYVNQTQDCSRFRSSRGYFSKPLSPEEESFPIAFSILMYTDVEQAERLLRAIYAPQNYYCIHIDVKASRAAHDAMRAIVRCFDNVFISSRLQSVYWGHISIVYAELSCMRDLVKYRWKYFVNLSGQMFPLHTNYELVRILQLYDGANDIEGSYKRSTEFYLRARNAFSWRLFESFNMMLMTLSPKGDPPYNITIYKGSNQVALTRAFVVYLLYDKTARQLTQWFADTLAPDEYIWPTINHNPQLHAPGAYKGDPETKTFTARATVWLPISKQINWSWDFWRCHGKWVREICVFGVGDLPWMLHRPELFVNKFHSNYEWLGYDCLEELMLNRTVARRRDSFDPSYYLNLPFVRDKNLVVSVDEAFKYIQ